MTLDKLSSENLMADQFTAIYLANATVEKAF